MTAAVKCCSIVVQRIAANAALFYARMKNMEPHHCTTHGLIQGSRRKFSFMTTKFFIRDLRRQNPRQTHRVAFYQESSGKASFLPHPSKERLHMSQQ